jgi:hypothetical protein
MKMTVTTTVAMSAPRAVVGLPIFTNCFQSVVRAPQVRRFSAMAQGLWHARWAVLVVAGALSGCDLLGIQTPEQIAAIRDAEGKAVGAACRHAGRAIEDCYALNRRADKAAVFAGWREMNDYMRENNLSEVPPVLPRPGASGRDGDEGGGERSTDSGKQDGARADATKGNSAKAEPDRSAKAGGPAKGEKAERTDKTDKAADGKQASTNADIRPPKPRLRFEDGELAKQAQGTGASKGDAQSPAKADAASAAAKPETAREPKAKSSN